MYRRDWDRIKTMASRIKSPKHCFSTIGSIACSISAICYLIAFFNKKEINTRGEELVSEMNDIESEFVSPLAGDKEYDI